MDNTKEPKYMADEEINLLDYVGVTARHSRMIILICAMAMIISVIVSLRLPKIYSATTVIMLPKGSEAAMSNIASKMGGIAAFAGGVLEMPSSTDAYIEILKSRTIADALIKRFDLMKVFETELMKTTRKRLEDSTSIKSSKASSVIVTVEDMDPSRAADLANAYVEELDKLNRKLNISDASRQRVFLEKRLEETEKILGITELKLKEFQEDNKIIALDEQTRISIQGAAKIKGEIIAIETELESLKGFATEENNEIVILNQKLAELKNQLIKIEYGQRKRDNSNNPGDHGNHNDIDINESDNFYISFAEAPSLGLQLARLTREVKIQEKVFELLTQQYELIKIAESKDATTIQVLDKALMPEVKSKPNRTLIVILTSVIAFFISIFMAFIVEHFKTMSNENKEHWQEIKADLRGNVPFMGKT